MRSLSPRFVGVPRAPFPFEKAGAWLLKEDGDGYRMASGRSSVYLFAGQLRYEGKS
jgi:hypothetical protein